MSASCYNSSALDEPSLLVEVQEEMEPNKLRRVPMHVGRALLKRIPYFEPQLEGELSGSSLQIRLPLGCSAEALSAIVRRMYCKNLAYDKLQVDIILPMAQCARMLCLEDLHVELVNNLGNCVQSESDVKKVVDWSKSHHDSELIAKFAKRYDRKGFMLEMDYEMQQMIINTIKSPGDGETMKLIEKLFKKRAAKGSDMLTKNIAIMKAVLTRSTLFDVQLPAKARGATHQTVQLSTWPGTLAFLEVVARLSLMSPETFGPITKMVFANFEQWTYHSPEKLTWNSSASSVFEKIATSLLDRLPCQDLKGQCVADLLDSITRNGYATVKLREPMCNVLKKLGQTEQMNVSRILSRMEPSHLKLLANMSVLQTLIGEARVLVCKRLVPLMSSLDPGTRKILTREMFGDSDDDS